MWKVLSVFAAVLTAGAALFSFLNKTDLEKETRYLDAAKNHKKTIDARLDEVLDEQKDFMGKQEAMDGRVTSETDAANNAKAELEAKQRELEDAEDKIKELEAEIAENEDKIKEIGDIEALVMETERLKKAIDDTNAVVAGLTQKLDNATNTEVATANQIQAAKDKEYRQRNGQMVATNAAVASVYNTWGFLILDSGDRQGIVSKAKLDVMRGGDKIAELVVTNIEPNRSVADIVPGSMEPGQMIRPGDKVAVNEASLPKPKEEEEATAPGEGGAEQPVAPEEMEKPKPTEPDNPFDFGTPDETPETPAPAETPADPNPFSGLE